MSLIRPSTLLLAALMASPQLFREWAPRVTTRKYDQSNKPPVEKTGLTLGMGMTEKQGGTDVRANTTKAERAGSGFFRLTGHKRAATVRDRDLAAVVPSYLGAAGAAAHSAQEQATAPRTLPIDVGAVIRKALRAAGLMKQQ